MDTVAERAREELRQAQIAVAQARREYRRHVRPLKLKIEILSNLLSGEVHGDPALLPNPQPSLNRSGTTNEYMGKPTVEVIQDILKKSSGSQRIIEITRQAIEGGYGSDRAEIDGERIFALFSSTLARYAEGPNPKFRKTGRGMFDLASRCSDAKPSS